MANMIGRGADQVPTNGMLGTAAFMSADRLPVSAPQQAALDAKISRIGSAVELALGNAGAARTIYWSAAQRQSLTLDQNTTLQFDWAGAPVGVYLLKITQDSTGGRTVAWSTGTPGTTRWLGSVVAPALHSAASGVSFAQVYWDGALAWGNLARVGAL